MFLMTKICSFLSLLVIIQALQYAQKVIIFSIKVMRHAYNSFVKLTIVNSLNTKDFENYQNTPFCCIVQTFECYKNIRRLQHSKVHLNPIHSFMH